MVMVYYREKIQIKKAKGRDTSEESRSVPNIELPVVLSLWNQDRITPLVLMCDSQH